MVPSSIATMIALLVLITVGVVSVFTGYIVCRLCGLPWGGKRALTDVAIAAGVAVASAYVVSSIDAAHGAAQSRVCLIIGSSVLAVAMRHLWRLVRSSTG